MRLSITKRYSGSIYYCPKCEQNNFLFEEIEKDVIKILFWTVREKITFERIYCGKCKCNFKMEDLKIIKNETYVSEGIKKKIFKETKINDYSIDTAQKTFIDYSEYIPKVENKTLYFDMLYMLIDYIETNQPSLSVDNNKFYQLAIEYKSIDDQEFNENFEEKIILKFKTCISEFDQYILNLLLRNSLNVLKDEILIDKKIEELYFTLFKSMNIGDLERQSFFKNLL